MNRRGVDKIFLGLLGALVFGGFFIFMSASMGLLAREGITFSKIVFNQVFFGLILGGIALLIGTKINYKTWHKYAFYIFIFSIILTSLVFVPKLGFSHGGAKRWLDIGSISLQPAEVLKIGFVIYFAAWLSGIKQKVQTLKFGVLPLVGFIGIVACLLLLQPDTGTFLVIFSAAMGMFIVAGGRWSHVSMMIGAGAVGVFSLAMIHPYIKSRLLTFFNPAADPLGAGYQIQQSLIAIGSGGVTGRGLGQSVQKFSFLPEPMGDSIFAVFSEEWGFIGATALIVLFLLFAIRGLRIASRAPDTFSRLLVTGLMMLIVSQSLINIASMLGVFPLTGMPLIFVSQGGTAMLFSLAAVGIVLNVSKYQRK